MIFDIPEFWNALPWEIQQGLVVAAVASGLLLASLLAGDRDVGESLGMTLVIGVVVAMGVLWTALAYGWSSIAPRFGFRVR